MKTEPAVSANGTYAHTQRGTLTIVAIFAMILVFALIGAFGRWQFFILIPPLTLIGWLFGSLTIQVSGSELRWRFGPGWFAKHVLLADIAAAEAVHTTLLEGWGIHWTRFGWLYNVSGFGAVAITLRNGKRFALGTDEPDALVEIIRRKAG